MRLKKGVTHLQAILRLEKRLSKGSGKNERRKQASIKDLILKGSQNNFERRELPNDMLDREEKTFELPQFYKSTKAPQPIKALPTTNFYDNHLSKPI